MFFLGLPLDIRLKGEYTRWGHKIKTYNKETNLSLAGKLSLYSVNQVL